MSSKTLLAAVGLAGAAVAIIKKLDKIEERLERIEKAEQPKPAPTKDEIEDVIFDLLQWKEAQPKTKRKVAFSVVKGVSKTAGRVAWNKITRKDK